MATYTFHVEPDQKEHLAIELKGWLQNKQFPKVYQLPWKND